MSSISIGLSALQTAQQGLAIAGNNLTNAATPGYHREVAEVSSLAPTISGGLSVGSGVTITTINRAVSQQLDAALTLQTSVNGLTDASLNASTQIQNAISTGTTSPATQVTNLLNSLQALSASPGSGSSQQAVVTSAQAVATAFNSASSAFTQLQRGIDQSISADVNQINSLTSQIASLNGQISSATNQGVAPNTLLDQRGEFINQLAQIANIQVQNSKDGQVTLISGGAALVAGGTSQTLAAGSDSSGNAIVTLAGSTTPINITGGDLGGLLSQRNGTLADYQHQLDKLAQQVEASFNQIQATGLGTSGGFKTLTGQNGVTSATAKLNAAGLSFPPTSGTLYVGVTNASTGQRTITGVPINPQSESLQDVANSISTSVPNLTAFVNSQTGTITLSSATGYTFDFSGGYEASPTTSFAGGSTTTPTISGAYSGSKNDQYTVTFNGSGSIGTTQGLTAQVTNQAGTVLGTINVGQGYRVGQPITLANGVTLALTAGSAVSGDSFSTPVVSNSDTAGILNALGLNTMFTGGNASQLSVSSAISGNPSLIASSTTGQPGDTSNLQRFVALNNAAVMNGGTQTFSDYANQMVSNIGTQVQSLTSQQSTNQTLTTNITNQQQSISGVDTNQELASVMKYQQQFEMASKYISAINDTIFQLINNVALH